MLLNNYHYILLNYTSASFAFSTCVFFISVMQSVNGAQFLNIARLLFLSATLAESCAPHINLTLALTF